MPPKELPGFYYDPEKNRYFPIRGPIPGAAARRPPAPAPAVPPPPADTTGCSRKRAMRPELLSAREMYGGGVISCNNAARSTFKQQCQYAQASQPMVWKYQHTTSVADKAIEQLNAMVQTPQGLKEFRVLVTGSMNGSIRLYGLGTALNNFENEAEFLPQPAWTPAGKHKAGALPSIWSSEVGYITFSSSISCIKKLGRHVPDASNTNSSVQRSLVATLGSGESGGSIYIMDLSEAIDSAMGLWTAYRVHSLDRTMWTADCSSDGTHAAFGSDIGAGLLDLETRGLSWLCQSKSDVLSLKFVHSGNVVLCGLRNGSIAPVDVRQKQHNQPTGVASSSNARRTVPMLPTRHAGKKRNQAGMDKISSVISMSSAVCSLVTLSSDENYFLGSSMDGSIKLFDLRLIQKGGIQSYEGHVNSHTHLPIVVDPSETLLMSGGEDCAVRIWSIKTGELLFAQSMSDTLFTAFCWPESSHDLCSSSLFDLNHSWGAWLGSRAGLFYMHGT
ncbi:hypothetical protein BDA96_02G007000 [Sorghum bicolor]|uniref:Uncharacterized protein n=1 Tax=Sorghum bicolor TaxID=4558 RepID=A0A921UR89_SORBI|nr:DDB1- and CUL4-associated factor 4 [Sorghum bicolor]KAG0541329.1 hypothetical protein BDA96_02G007000 [Sorghum bicolor]|eukprot:XP_021310605.1 DDB1- and CUL4-associated factor 4 [Sorghum bicolor]